jgi:hypothetical protein
MYCHAKLQLKVILGSLWVVVGRCGVVVGRCGSLWVVVDRCGSLWVVPCFSNYAGHSHKFEFVENLNYY